MTQRPDTGPAHAARQTLPVAAAVGLYIPSFQRGHREHELTQRIRHGKLSGAHDAEFAGLLAQLAAQRSPGFKPELVVSCRRGQASRIASRRSAASWPSDSEQPTAVRCYGRRVASRTIAG
jgi:hypothetical protein